MLHLFDDLSSSLLSIVLCHHGGQTVHIQSVLSDTQDNKDLKHYLKYWLQQQKSVSENVKLIQSEYHRDNDLLSW